MKYLTLITLAGIISVGVFGFVGMNHEIDHGSANCVVSVVNVAACPSETISIALYHIATYNSFSQTTIVSLSLLAPLFFITVRGVREKPVPIPIVLSPYALRYRNMRHTSEVEFTHWLSRFENSPSVRYSA